jgi:hypothetical protein
MSGIEFLLLSSVAGWRRSKIERFPVVLVAHVKMATSPSKDFAQRLICP